VEAAARLSARYVNDRFLPDKAIDLIDEASSRVRMYKSPAAKVQKDLINKLREMRRTHALAVEEGRLNEAKQLLESESVTEQKLTEMRSSWDRANSPVVTADDIAEVVSMWTGVPVMQMATEESERLLKMEDELHKSVVGQNEAITAISKAIRRARAGLKDPRRPIGSFMFLGPTGVGKTELAKSLALFLFGSEDALIQLDMSEFTERHTVSRLVGAPPGYVGFEEAGQLTEAIRRHPYSIVVFDEVEKAHPEAHNMLLQIMEEGHLSDARGHKVDFRNAIIIMTTNIGADMIKRQGKIGFQAEVAAASVIRDYDDMRKSLLDSLKKAFRPEFINRLDSVIVFHALDKSDLRAIVELELNKVGERLKEHELKLAASDAALDELAAEGYDPEMGARPLRRVIQQKIEEILSDKVLAKEFKDGDTIWIDLDKEKQIVLKKKKAARKPASEPEPVAP
jgi:ATP-dependent Clp protease ATP-binding subunit ClpC